MALTKVSGGILDPGINVAGIVTATGFDGPFTGGSTKNITAGVVTATSLDLNGNGDISGNLVIGGNLTANGDFTTLNTTLREVEILRVDASSGEPAGIITQTGAGDILRLYDGTSQVVTVLDTGEVGIGTINPSSYGGAVKLALHSSGHTGLTIAAGTGSDGNIFFADGVSGDTTYRGNIKYAHNGDSMRLHTAATEHFRISSDGKVKVGHVDNANPTEMLHVVTKTVNQDIARFTGANRDRGLVISTAVSGSTNDSVIKYNADSQNSVGQHVFLTDGDEKLRIDANGRVRIGNADLTTSSKADDLIVGTTSGHRGITIFSGTANTGNIYFGDTSTGGVENRMGTITYDHSGNFMRFSTSGNQEKVRILSTGEVGIGITNPSDMFHVVGSGKFIKTSNNYVHVGSSNAGGAAIVLDGDSNGDGVGADYAYIEHDTSGDLNIVVDNPANAGNIKFWTNTSEERLRILSDGAIRIPDGSNTTSRLLIGSGSGALYVYHDGNTKFENATGYLKLQCNNNLYIDGNEIFFRDEGGTNRWRILTTGHLVPGAAGTYDIGSTSAEVGNVYLADNKKAFFGSDQDLSIYSSGTNGFIDNDTGYLLLNTTSDLVLRANADVYLQPAQGENALKATANGSVDLYYDQNNHTTPKLKTSATGITVDGEVAASQDYPDFEPVLNFNFAGSSTQLDPRLLYRRSGVASFYDANGLVKLVGENTPRFDHDPISRKNKGILIEHSRTNLFPYGTTPGDLWSSSKSGTFEENTTETTAPDGTFTATKWTFTNSDPYIYHAQTLSANTSYTVTMYVKAGTNMAGDYVQIRIGAAPYSPNGDDITIPTDGTWKRISYTKTVGGSAENSANIGFEPQVKPSGNPASGDVIYIWGAQLEVGGYASSFIPTYGRTQTRGADLLVIDGDDSTALSDVYNDQEGTLVVEYHNVTTDGSYVATIDDGSGDNRFGISNSNSSQGISVSGGSSQGQLDNGTPIVGATNKMAHAYKLNDRGLSLNGNNATQDNGFALPTGIRFIWIGCRAGSYDFLGSTISRFMYYTKRLPNSQLKLLTSQ